MIFKDTSSKQGIVEDIDFLCDTDDTSYPIAQKVRNVNRWGDKFVALALNSDGRWQWDDTNWTDLPIGRQDLVAEQYDYQILAASPSTGQDFLRVLRVEVLDSSGNWTKLKRIDQADIYNQSLTDFLKTSGTPLYYDDMANTIFLYPKPSANITLGLKVYFQRNFSYFTSSDTTKVPGIPSVFHRYLSLGASFDYAVKKQLPQKNDINVEILKMEEAIKEFFAFRNKDEKVQVSSKYRRQGWAV